jgi:hypothetical protein
VWSEDGQNTCFSVPRSKRHPAFTCHCGTWGEPFRTCSTEKNDRRQGWRAHTLEIRKEIEIAAPIEVAFKAILEELGPEAR